MHPCRSCFLGHLQFCREATPEAVAAPVHGLLGGATGWLESRSCQYLRAVLFKPLWCSSHTIWCGKQRHVGYEAARAAKGNNISHNICSTVMCSTSPQV